MKIAKLAGVLGTIIALVAIAVAAAAMVMNTTAAHMSENLSRMDKQIDAMSQTYHVPQNEHAALEKAVKENTDRWADINAQLASQRTLLGEMSKSIVRIENRVVQHP